MNEAETPSRQIQCAKSSYRSRLLRDSQVLAREIYVAGRRACVRAAENLASTVEQWLRGNRQDLIA